VRERRGRIVAVGTTVVRALESAALGGRVRAGEGTATLRIGPATALRVVDAVLTGVHEPGTSHHELLRAFVDDATLRRVDTELMGRGYRAHEFGDSVLIERSRAAEADSTDATRTLDRRRLVAIREP
jgi:S-adenosylmethionine:tRNA ribosyltransferase-isomerase